MKINYIYIFPPLLLFITCHILCAIGKSNLRCDSPQTDWTILWSREAGTTPFASAPLLEDFDGDGDIDVSAVTVGGDVTVLSGKTGNPLLGSIWPAKLLHDTVHSSPLEYDIDRDGKHELMFTTTKGNIQFYSSSGNYVEGKNLQIGPIYVEKNWYKSHSSVALGGINRYVMDDATSISVNKLQSYIKLQPHVFATPVISDLNNDGTIEELVLTVSYFIDPDPDFDNNQTQLDGNNYLVGGIVVMNLTSLSPIGNLYLELTKKATSLPGYILFSPTLVDLSGGGAKPDIVVGTSAGHLHVVDPSGKSRAGFPQNVGVVNGQIAAEDLTLDGALELVVTDTTGNVVCFSSSGTTLWQARVSQTQVTGARFGDIDLDGRLDVIVATADARLHVLEGATGASLPGWPLKTSKGLIAPPLITKLNDYAYPSIIVLSEDGNLYIFSERGVCKQAFSLGETSWVTLLSHDLTPQYEGLELLLASKDGTLLCLGQQQISNADAAKNNIQNLRAWPAEAMAHNIFTFWDDNRGIVVEKEFSRALDINQDKFLLSFEIVENMTPAPRQQYRVVICVGSLSLGHWRLREPGTYTVQVRGPGRPMSGKLVVYLTNRHGQVYKDSMPVNFYTSLAIDLQWLLIGPAIGMAVLLYLLHGLALPDLLPFIYRSKTL